MSIHTSQRMDLMSRMKWLVVPIRYPSLDYSFLQSLIPADMRRG
jgi:hypothetical protein